LGCVLSQGDNILDIGLEYKYRDITKLGNEFSLKSKQGLFNFFNFLHLFLIKKKE